MEKNASTEDMKTPVSSSNKLVREGYTENFRVTENGLSGTEAERFYTPEEIEILDYFRFEGASDPADNSILYAIRTIDGKKGTLTDAYGTYADPAISKFIKKVEDISKKQSHANPEKNG